MTPTEPRTDSRADRFVRELAELRIPDPAATRSALWLRLGAALMVVGLVLALSAYFVTHNTQNPLDQRDGLALGLGGIAATVVGAALFLRHSLTGFLRFWMVRQSHDLAVLADRLCERDLNHDLTSTDAAPR
jgi:UDP-N-acetylmuramyl pentapeptide phosphotransferase/UDP-N-acetylglucosamine-1-phosphate transferase